MSPKNKKPPRRVTHSGEVRRRLAEIEQRMHDGTLQAVLVDELREAGFDMSIAMFRTLLKRARQRRIAAGGSRSENPPIAPAPVAEPSARPAAPPPPSTAPKLGTPQDIEALLSKDIDLDKI